MKMKNVNNKNQLNPKEIKETKRRKIMENNFDIKIIFNLIS